MADSTKSVGSGKPTKPRPDFPLFPHATGRWAKKINGKLFYFGPWRDAEGAERRFKAEHAILEAGITKPPTAPVNTVAKPKKPHKDFPLFAHATKRWAKKVRGKLHYFGSWSNPDGALNKWLEQKDALLAGLTPRATTTGLTLRELVNRYLTAKQQRVTAGELKPRTFDDYYKACDRLLKHFGKDRTATDITTEDFAAFRAKLAKTFVAPSGLSAEIQRIRTAFNWAFAAGILETPIRFGPDFAKPSRRAMRAYKQANPPRFLTREQILDLIDRAGRNVDGRLPSPELKAAILMGVNCGWGNADVAGLDLKNIDLKKKMADYPRAKTAIERRCPLWPETVEALKVVLHRREKMLTPAKPYPTQTVPANEVADADKNAVFITRMRGRYVVPGKVDSIGLAFGRLLREAGYKQEGVNFYSLRHVFQTIAGETGDQVAVDLIMGHVDERMAAHYREWQKDEREDDRLRKVTDHVRHWLYGPVLRRKGNKHPNPVST